MPKLTRKDFVDTHAQQKLDLNKLDKAARAAVASADLNKDGVISGAAENDALFTAVDRFDHDGSAQSILTGDALGNKTAAGTLLDALNPAFGPTGKPATQSIADAALDRIAKFGKDYGVGGAWKTPNPGIPGNKHPDETAYTALQGRWKCNCFAMDCLYQAGFLPPTYSKDGKGWYPVAVDLHNFASGPNRFFDQKGELKLNSMSEEQKQARITELMKQAQPGDLIIVKHQGPVQADGGHCRVVTANNFDKDGTVSCAQASFNSAIVRDETVGSFSSEDTMWLLRPCRQRA